MTHNKILTILPTLPVRAGIAIIVLILSALSTTAQTNNEAQFFQLPIIPDSIKNFQDRADFMVKHYWDFCDLDKSFSSRDKMATAFDTYLSFMPYATATVVYEEIPRFMKRIEKKGEHVAFIGNLVEQKLYSDTAEYQSDDLFLAFANEITANKKVDKQTKSKFKRMAESLSNSMPGVTAQALDYTDRDGNTGRLTFIVENADSLKEGTILMFSDPSTDAGRMARLRLDTDILTRRIVEGGKLDIVNIYPAQPDEKWMETSGYNPKSWKSIASPSAADNYDLRYLPMFYVVNHAGSILLKTPDINAILQITNALSQRVAK